MRLGWHDGGYGELRATGSDRREVLKLVRIAEREGRLDATEYDRRLRAVEEAGTRAQLVALAADLPARSGERDWDDSARVRRDDRELAVRILAEGTTHGRLATREYEQRVAALPAVATYGQLKVLLNGLPGWPGAPDDLLVDTADRDAARDELSKAVADNRVDPLEVPALDVELTNAQRRSDLDRLLTALANRIGDQRRDQAAQQIETAYQAGQLDAREQAERVAKVRHSTTPSQLAELLRDLTGDNRRPTDADRESMLCALATALDRHRLTLPEYERRLAVATTATSTVQLRTLLADLVEPPKQRRRGPLDALFDRFVVSSALLKEPDTWWRRPIPRLAWKVAAVVPLAVYGAFLVWKPVVALVVLVTPLGWLLVPGYVFGLAAFGYYRDSKAAQKRTAQTVRGLCNELSQIPGVRSAEITYPTEGYRGNPNRSQARIVLELTRDGPRSVEHELAAAVTRAFWLSRLYPLGTLIITVGRGEPRIIRWNRAERRRLRDKYGPRPYSLLPSWHEDPNDL